MNQLSHFLYPGSVNLALSAIDQEAALQEIVAPLRYDSRVSNWPDFSQKIPNSSTFPIEVNKKNSIMIHHLRTNTVQDLILTVGRSQGGIRYSESNDLVFLIFVMALPQALNNEYLRAMGVIARLCQEPAFLNVLLASPTSEQFIKLLSQEKL